MPSSAAELGGRRSSAGQPHHVQPDDELFPVDGQSALFGLPGVEEKLLFGCPGANAKSPSPAVTLWREFIAARL